MNALGLLEGVPLNSLFMDCSYPSCPSKKAIRFNFLHRTLMTRSLLVSSRLLMLQVNKMSSAKVNVSKKFKGRYCYVQVIYQHKKVGKHGTE